MNAVLREALHSIALGTAMQGGFFAGAYAIGDKPYGLIVAPKASGEFKPMAWNSSYNDVAPATSFVDGLANTRAMAEAGSAMAKKALATTIDDFSDWYIAAQDEKELLFRAFNPSMNENSDWGRSGINVSAIPPTYPYSVQPAPQTSIEAFREGGPEAFELEGYWTSTQHASLSSDAWGQGFDNGFQGYWDKLNKRRARLVRRFAI